MGNVSTYTDTAVVENQIYYYRVSAVNAVGEGTTTGSVDITIGADEGPVDNTMLYLIAIILLVVVAAVVIFLYVKRRK